MEARNIVSINNIREAYQKLKTYIYNDSFNLRLRTKLALFERDNNLEDRFNILLQHIMDSNIESYLSSVSTYILPKKVESVSENLISLCAMILVDCRKNYSRRCVL